MHSAPQSSRPALPGPLASTLLWALLAVSSLYLIEKYFGLGAIPLYLGYVAILVVIWRSEFANRLMKRVDERTARILALATLLALVAIFALVYPVAKSGRWGGGSDADDALNKAVAALLRGEFLYRQKTYLGNPITPMPGELILAIPFVVAGNGAWQIFFWLPVGFLLARRGFGGSTARALGFAWLVLAACPAVLHHLVTGIDYAPCSIALLAFALALCAEADRDEPLSWKPILLAALFGLALSSRANFVFLIPLVAGRVVQVRGLRNGSILIGTALLTACAATLPFLLYNPAGFTPIRTLEKLAVLEAILPHAAIAISISAALLAIALARPSRNRSLAALLRNATLVQAFLILVPAALWAAIDPHLFPYTGYSELFLYFGLAFFIARFAQESPCPIP